MWTTSSTPSATSSPSRASTSAPGQPAIPTRSGPRTSRPVLDAIGDDVAQREYAGYFGPTPVGATLVDFYGFDMVAHRWDLARTLLREAPFTESEMDELEESIAVFGDAMYGEGICHRPVPVPRDASRQDHLLALLGRDPRT